MQTNDESTRMESVSLSQKFAEIDGRRPRVFIPELEDDGCHEERKMAAALLADAGWDVDVGAPQSAEESAQTASDNDVHFIYYLSRSNGKTALLVKMMQALTVMGRDDILTAVHDCSDSEKKSPHQVWRYRSIPRNVSSGQCQHHYASSSPGQRGR